LQKYQFTRIIPSGANQRIQFVTSLNPDSTSNGDINVRVTTQPEPGKVEITSTSHFPSYSKESNRYKCNEHKVKGVLVNYKAEKYVGDDAFDLLIIYPGGLAREVHYDMNVRRTRSTSTSPSVNGRGKMKRLLLTVLAFGLLSSSAFAEEQPRQEGLQKKQFTRVVASGTNQRISFFHALNPDCTASGNLNIRVTKQPEHGTAETTTATNFPTYPKESLRARCNEHKVRGVQVNYKSAEKYVGSDELELLVLFPGGTAWEVHYNIDVR
jgi:hypothetical protein